LMADDAPQSAGPSMVVRALGDDEWCVLTLPGRASSLECLLAGASLHEWVGARSSIDAAQALQDRGIAAAPMLRVADLPGFAYCAERDCFRSDRHPYLAAPVVSERAAAHYRNLAAPPDQPAPLSGEQTNEVIATWLGLGVAEMAALEGTGILQPTAPTVYATIDSHLAAEASPQSPAAVIN